MKACLVPKTCDVEDLGGILDGRDADIDSEGLRGQIVTQPLLPKQVLERELRDVSRIDGDVDTMGDTLLVISNLDVGGHAGGEESQCDSGEN